MRAPCSKTTLRAESVANRNFHDFRDFHDFFLRKFMPSKKVSGKLFSRKQNFYRKSRKFFLSFESRKTENEKKANGRGVSIFRPEGL